MFIFVQCQQSIMIEEECELLQVVHRLASQERQDESGDSDDDFFLVDPGRVNSIATVNVPFCRSV